MFLNRCILVVQGKHTTGTDDWMLTNGSGLSHMLTPTAWALLGCSEHSLEGHAGLSVSVIFVKFITIFFKGRRYQPLLVVRSDILCMATKSS
jgi:hypothetical protein